MIELLMICGLSAVVLLVMLLVTYVVVSLVNFEFNRNEGELLGDYIRRVVPADIRATAKNARSLFVASSKRKNNEVQP